MPGRSVVEAAWGLERLGDALEALAARSRLEPRPLGAAAAPPRDPESVDGWLREASMWMGIDIEPVVQSRAELARSLRSCGPTLLRIESDDAPRFLVVLHGRRGRIDLLAPAGCVVRAPLERVVGALRSVEENAARVAIERLVDDAGVPRRRRERAVAALLDERLGAGRTDGTWRLGLSPSADFASQLRRMGLPATLAGLVAVHTASYALWILSWWSIGRGALEGRLDPGWLLAWALILLTLVPAGMLGTWLQGLAAVAAGGLVKRRLLAGTLRLEPEEVRHRGAGQLLGQVIESEAIESLAVSGGLAGLLALVELLGAAVVLALGAGGGLHVALLVLWILVTGYVGLRYLRARREWTSARLDLTDDLVERLVGHRTRLAQEAPARWHSGEDDGLERMLERSKRLDRTGAVLAIGVPTGWLVLGLLGLAPAFVLGTRSIGEIAVGLGGVLLAQQALSRLSGGARHLAGAAIAWRAIGSLFRAASRREPVAPPGSVARDGESTPARDGPLVVASDLAFRYVERGEPVLRGCSIRVDAGDRVLLEGPSGGGKSTLASIVAGLRQPGAGLVLLDGLDRATIGSDGWRARVATAPQFHENHVLTGTLAFNLLMGRGWPPRHEDLAEAEEVCRELGLGPLLDRMPGGILQMVGETGWQLSHGERSRIYIARALLQGADLVVLDESFAALDPESLRRCLTCVLDRAPSLLVIAHP